MIPPARATLEWSASPFVLPRLDIDASLSVDAAKLQVIVPSSATNALVIKSGCSVAVKNPRYAYELSARPRAVTTPALITMADVDITFFTNP
jgi:hypothetical protein